MTIKNSKLFIKFLKYPIIIFLAIILGGSFHVFTSSVLGWNNPGSAPHGGNTAKPVNIGTAAQDKTGNLTASDNLQLNANLQVTGAANLSGNTTTVSGKFWMGGKANVCRKEESCSGSACASSCSASNYYVVAIGGSDNRLLNPSSPSTATYRICCKNAD